MVVAEVFRCSAIGAKVGSEVLLLSLLLSRLFYIPTDNDLPGSLWPSPSCARPEDRRKNTLNLEMMTASPGDNSTSGVSDSDISKILNAVTKNGDEFTRGDASVRRKLLADVRRLSLLLETPAEAIVRIAWAEVRASTQDFVAIMPLTDVIV